MEDRGDDFRVAVEVTDLEPFLVDLAERTRRLTQKHGASLQRGLVVQGRAHLDQARIEQAVLILVDNAAKYSPEGKSIVLRSQLAGHEVMIEVIDEGNEISADELPFIFERFYRIDKARSRKHGGAGLGLAIAQSIVAAHEGRIEAMNQINRGTRLRLFLPLLTATQTVHPPLYAVAKESTA